MSTAILYGFATRGNRQIYYVVRAYGELFGLFAYDNGCEKMVAYGTFDEMESEFLIRID